MPDSLTVPSGDVLLNAAVRAALRGQDASVSRLQRDLRLGYGVAVTLVEQLKQSGILLLDWPGRERGLHPDYRDVRFWDVSDNEALVYARRIANLAIFYFEMAEQDNDAHSALVRMMLPPKMPASQWREVQNFFRRGCYAGTPMTITNAALAFHTWGLGRGLPPADHAGLETAIRAECLPYERPFMRLTDPAVMLNRAYIRLARFFRQAATDGMSLHSRIPEYVVQNRQTPQSAKTPGRMHPEHVVPCAVQRNIACEMFRDGHSVYDVAQLLKKLHVVIWIDRDAERKKLDIGPENLQDRMLADWRPEDGCIYARLHEKHIPFEPPPSHPCTCGAAH